MTADQKLASTETPLSLREALRHIWLAEKYPCPGNEDWAVATRLTAEALERAGKAVPAPDDLPEFAAWITALRKPDLSDDEREEIFSAVYDLFDPEDAVFQYNSEP